MGGGGSKPDPPPRPPSPPPRPAPTGPQCQLEQPYRRYYGYEGWNEACRLKLRNTIANEKPYGAADFNSYKVLILGPCGAGKSSFKNTIKSAFIGQMCCQADVGYDPRSLTRKYAIGPVRDREGKNVGQFRFADMPGLEYMTMDDITIGGLLDGRLESGTTIEDGKIPQLNPEQDPKKRIHCLMVAIDGSKIDMMDATTSNIFKIVKSFRAQARERDIPIVAVVTHLDKLCGCFSNNLEKALSCKTVKETIKTVSQKLAIDANRVFIHRSYSDIDQVNVDAKLDCLTLITVKHLLQYCREYVDNWLDTRDDDYD